MSRFVFSILFILLFANVPQFSLIDETLIEHVALTILFAWFISNKTFDAKKTFEFIKSVISYMI